MKKLGYTLTEVLITIGIIGTISALLIPGLTKTTKSESDYEEIPLSDEEKKAFEQKIIETRKLGK